MKPAISVGGRTGTAHNPTVGEWGTFRRGVPGLWPGTPRLQSWEDVTRGTVQRVSSTSSEVLPHLGLYLCLIYAQSRRNTMPGLWQQPTRCLPKAASSRE